MTEIAAIKRGITIESVLDYFGIAHRHHRAACPIHGGDNPTAFNFNDEVFYCHTHGCKGDVIDLVKALAKTDFKGAVDYLCRKQGFAPFPWTYRARVTAPTDADNHDRLPSREELGLFNTKIDMQFCSEMIQVFTEQLRNLNQQLKAGQIEPEVFYARQQRFDRWLEELDEWRTALRYQLKHYTRPKDNNHE